MKAEAKGSGWTILAAGPVRGKGENYDKET
jgi:hypothetical protein